MSELQQQVSNENDDFDDPVDEFVVIHEGEEEFDKGSTTSETTAQQSVKDNSSLQSAGPGSTTTSMMADIGKGLDGAEDGTVSLQNTPMSGSYPHTPFNSSFFGALDSSMMVSNDQLRELVRSENEQNRTVLDQIKNTLSELANEKSSNNDLTELIAIHKQSLADTQNKLTISEQNGLAKDTKIAKLEEHIAKLMAEKDELGMAVNKSRNELANKDEIINVLREQTEEQQNVYETRVKMWRQRMDELEQTLSRYHDRGELKCAVDKIEEEKHKKEGESEESKPIFFICENCLNAFPRFGYLRAHHLRSDCE